MRPRQRQRRAAHLPSATSMPAAWGSGQGSTHSARTTGCTDRPPVCEKVEVKVRVGVRRCEGLTELASRGVKQRGSGGLRG